MRVIAVLVLLAVSFIGVDVRYLKNQPIVPLLAQRSALHYDEQEHVWVDKTIESENWFTAGVGQTTPQELYRIRNGEKIPVKKQFLLKVNNFYRRPESADLTLLGVVFGVSANSRKYCGAPWCTSLSAKANGEYGRSIAGTPVCRNCYQYVWQHAKESREPMAVTFVTIEPPKRPLERVPAICERKGCWTALSTDDGHNYRRTIGSHHLCRGCYQTTWQFGKRHALSLKQALEQVPAKSRSRNVI